MIAVLPNLRWLCLPSENLGEDWKELVGLIDTAVDYNGLELSEESVYLLFSHKPQDILDGQGSCLVGRPVIGPRKAFEGALKLVDWSQAPVIREEIQGRTLTELLERAKVLRKSAQNTLPKIKDPFTLCVHRRLKPELLIQTEVIFNE